ILKSHTDPFGYCPEERFHQVFDSTVSALPDSAGIGAFVQTVAELMNVMRDSHSSLDYGGLLQYQLSRGGYIIPLRVHSDENGIRVEKDYAKKVPAGSRLLRINGHSADSLWQIAYRYSSIEGISYTGKRRVADALFPIIIGLHIPIGEKV